jgi:hypothetical protein
LDSFYRKTIIDQNKTCKIDISTQASYHAFLLTTLVALLMFSYKKITRTTILILMFSMTLGCATTYHGDGIIISEQKIGNKNHFKAGKKAGTRGAMAGGIAGVSFAAWCGHMVGGVTLASVGDTLLAMAVLGTLEALTIGTPVAVAAGTFYLIDKSNKRNTYQFKIKSLEENKTFTIDQYAVPMPVNTKVKILERNGSVFIKKKTTA